MLLAAEFVASEMSKPVAGFIAGTTAPPGSKRSGRIERPSSARVALFRVASRIVGARSMFPTSAFVLRPLEELKIRSLQGTNRSRSRR